MLVITSQCIYCHRCFSVCSPQTITLNKSLPILGQLNTPTHLVTMHVVMASKLDKQTTVSEFDPHWAPYICL